jgi:hypothetical protein
MSLPIYTQLRKIPSRSLPADLRKAEDSAANRTRQDMFEIQLQSSSLLPKPDTPALTIFVSDGSNLVTNPIGKNDDGKCIHVFSERWRAVDYARTRLADHTNLSFAVLSPEGFISLLREVEATGRFAFTIDCCPRCDTFTPYESTLADEAAYLVEMIGVHKSSEMARRYLYYHYALAKARAGQHAVARDVLLESVGHVTMSDPDTHLLLGQLGIAMEDDELVREAHEYLRFFGSGAWDRKLESVELAGKADFEGPESSR